ncbi:hypothetical protein [Mycolicibacterium sp. lyk4-40-TYG-92]|uniref:hypothetical protein n=1 Tax=Mycolicibacterium sp. lyk4-40-TYG-92 TaxID=3040295 RepID=UPI00254D311A|nr:hypothetical protein [Mycolicibacterium sp. lyk4-40-TYG-92]
MSDESQAWKALEFERLVGLALRNIFDGASIEAQPRLGDKMRPDFVVHLNDGRIAIVEVKSVMPATAHRIDQAAAQLRSLQQAYLQSASDNRRPAELILAVPGVLAPEHVSQLMTLGVDAVLDGPRLHDAAPELDWSRVETTRRPVEEVGQMALARQLLAKLRLIPPGKPDWALYQSTTRDLLAVLWCPPLESPLSEHANVSGVNRRDIILPNYADSGMWRYLRDRYAADYVVVDTKNYVGRVKKAAVLQMANYLGARGTGLLGIIVCRNAADNSAEVTRREQWFQYGKLIVILNDNDLEQMVLSVASDDGPAVVVRQKIEDFRLSI